MHVYYIPTVQSDYYGSLLKSLPENQIFLWYMKGSIVSITNYGQITIPYQI